MANLRHDRVPDRTLSPAPVPGSQGPALSADTIERSIQLSIRLRTLDSSGAPAGVSFAEGSPAAALVHDLLSASSGELSAARGAVVSAGFIHIQAALLAARRLQWALQGLAGLESCRNIAATILIHASDDPITPLDQAAPGQILVSPSLSSSVPLLPHVLLRASTLGSWHELQETNSEPAPTYAADEQSVLHRIGELGRQDPCPPVPQPNPAIEDGQKPGAVGTRTTGARTAVEPAPRETGGLGRSQTESDSTPASQKKRWLVIGGAAAAVLLLAALGIAAFVSSRHSTSPAASSSTTPTPAEIVPSASPAAPAGKQAAKPSPQKPARANSGIVAKPKTDQGSEPRTSEGKTPPPSAASCDLTEADIPRSLSRAENYMYAGKLADAQATYQRLLGCPSAHEKAQEGLQRVKQRIAAQSLSSPQ